MKLKPHPFARNESSDSFIPFAKHSIRNIAKRELRRAFRDMELCSGLKNKRGWGGQGWSTISGTDYRWPISCWEPRINICMAVAPTVRSQQRAWKSQAHWSWPLSTSITLSLTPIIGARLSLFNSLLDVLNPIVASSNSALDQLLQTQTCIVAFNSCSSFMVYRIWLLN